MLKMKVHEVESGKILALCDEELLGNRYKEGERVLDLDKYGSFYNGESVSEESTQIESVAKQASSINAVGKRAVEALKKMGFEVKNSKKVEGIPHLQIFVID